MSNKFEAAKQIYKGGKYVFETVVPKIAKNLTQRRKVKDEAFKSIDEKGKGLSLQKRSNIKKSFSGKASKIFDDASKARKGKMGGGFMGKRMGYSKGTPKPDFLDLDKDGNTSEPMKQAAKQAKRKK